MQSLDEIKREIYQTKLDLLQTKARSDILAFTLYTKKDYAINWHHRKIAEALNKFVMGDPDYRFLMIFMPPRHGKSELVSRRLPAFIHGIYPDDLIMATSYLDSLASDMCMDVQKIMDSEEYQELFPQTKLYGFNEFRQAGRRNSTEHHILDHNGKYLSQGVGGSFTGKGANWIIIDDPIKGRESADSESFREKLWAFYNNDLFSRLETKLDTGRQGRILITQTRWHEDDLSGRLIDLMHSDPSATKWKIVDFPAIKADNSNDEDPREVGDPLWPEKYNIEALNQIKASIGTRAWSSLYQQNPVPDGGSLFNENMFKFVDEIKTCDWYFCTADTSYKEKQENDFTVFSIWGVVNKELYLHDVKMKQIKSSDIELEFEPFIRRFLYYSYRGTYIEPKGHGIYLNQRWAKKHLYIPSEEKLKEFYADRRWDKVERANNILPHLANRQIMINKNIPNKEDLVAQCLGFPKVKHDDFVDTLIDAVKKVFAMNTGGIASVFR